MLVGCTGPPLVARVRGQCNSRHGALRLGDSEVSVLGFELAAHVRQLVCQLVAWHRRVRAHVLYAHRVPPAQRLRFAPHASYLPHEA